MRRGVVLAAVVVMVVTGCSLFGLGGPKTTHLILTGDAKLNNCGGQLGNALAIRVYQLSGDAAIRDLPLLEVWQHDRERLGDQLLEYHEIFIDPGSRDTLSLKALPACAFLAVVGNFCNAEGDCWRWMRPVDDLPKEVWLTFGEACIVEGEPDSEPAPQPASTASPD